MAEGSAPEREYAGSLRPTTTSFLHWTPDHEQGEGAEVFHNTVRPPTAERRERRAELAAARSEEDEDEGLILMVKTKMMMKIEKIEGGLFFIVGFSVFWVLQGFKEMLYKFD